jgi:hypothetical protein
MKKALIVLLLLAALATQAGAAAKWAIESTSWRPDENKFASQQVYNAWNWVEGWKDAPQLYPDNLVLSGSVHVILRNMADKPESLKLTEVDGQPLSERSTTPTRPGRVVWYMVHAPRMEKVPDSWDEQRDVPAGEWVDCSLRLRRYPTGPVVLGFTSGSGFKFTVSVDPKPAPKRLESISFSPKIDRIYIYVRNLSGQAWQPTGRVLLEKKDLTSATTWTAGPKGSGLALGEVKLDKPLEYGTFHLLDVYVPGARLVYPLRAWDCHFGIGMYGEATPERVKAAKEHGIDTYFGGARDKVMNDFEMYTSPCVTENEKQRKPGDWGCLYYYNWDEPDCWDFHEGEAIKNPLDRLGVCAHLKVLPVLQNQRRYLPRTLNFILCDNTFKPANWYCYGQMADVFGNDAYVTVMGKELGYIPAALECMRDASTPRPTVAVLWACSDGGPNRNWGGNNPLPDEERLNVFYSLGSGAKGIAYFIDLTQKPGEGTLTGASEFPALWEEMGRINRDVRTLAPYLSIGCPASAPRIQNKAWTRSVMCGPDTLFFVVVNTQDIASKVGKVLTSKVVALKNVAVSFDLPPSFKDCTVSEVVDAKMVPMKATVKNGKVTLSLSELKAARAFVVTSKAGR